MINPVEIRKMLLQCSGGDEIYVDYKFDSGFSFKPTKEAYIQVPKENWETLPYFMPKSTIHVYIDKIKNFKELLFLFYMIDKNKMMEVRNDGLINKFIMIRFFIEHGFDLLADIQIHYNSKNWTMDYKNRKYDYELHEFINKDMEEKFEKEFDEVYWDSFTNTVFYANAEKCKAAYDEAEKALREYREKVKKQEEKMYNKPVLHVVYSPKNYIILNYLGKCSETDDDPICKSTKFDLQYSSMRYSGVWSHTVFMLGIRISDFLYELFDKLGDPVDSDYIPHIAINIAEHFSDQACNDKIYHFYYDFTDPEFPELIQNGD